MTAKVTSLVARDVSFRVGGRTLLKPSNLHVDAGEVLCVLGPNGAGKSTLMRLLTGQVSPATGDVAYNGRSTKTLSVQELALRRSVLSQETRLDFAFSAEEVVMMGRSAHSHLGRERDERIVQEAMQRVGVSHLARQAYTSLSGGERQRVQFSRVMAQIWEDGSQDEPKYLLLDEPVSALDIKYQHRTLEIAQALAHEQGIGVFAILHDLNLAAWYADRLALICDGEIVAVGEPTAVLEAATISRVFGVGVTVSSHPMRSEIPWVVTPSC